jgi:hypothetical protein
VSQIRTFFRHCPGCGRRFEIRLVSKTLIREDRVTSTLPEIKSLATPDEGPAAHVPLTVSQGHPITVDTEEFQYVYKCAHCGHQWSEKRDIEHMER